MTTPAAPCVSPPLMPRELRRSLSDDSTSAESFPCTPAVHDQVAARDGLATPPKDCLATPPKRRRLTIRSAPPRGADEGSPHKASDKDNKTVEAAEDAGGVETQERAASQPPSCSFEPAPAGGAAAWETPSRADGIAEKAERKVRLLVSARARALVRDALEASGGDLDQVQLRAQLLACRNVQLFFSFYSIPHESPEVLAFGAAALALEAVGSPLGAEDVLQDAGVQPERALLAWISEVEGKLRELLLVDANEGDRCQPQRPLDMAVYFAGVVAARLPDSEGFRAACARPAAAAERLAPHLAQVARCFVVDSHQGADSLTLPPRTLAAAAAALAARYLLRRGGVEVGAEECFCLVGADQGDSELSPGRLRGAASKIVDINRLWLEEDFRSGPAASVA